MFRSGRLSPASPTTELITQLDSIVDLRRLHADARAHGFGPFDRLIGDYETGTNRFEKPGETLLVANVQGAVVGVCGLNIDPFAADRRIGRIRRLYVQSSFRRDGLGRGWVHAIEAVGARSFEVLRLRTHDVEAGAFYRALGYVGIDDPNATHLKQLGIQSPEWPMKYG